MFYFIFNDWKLTGDLDFLPGVVSARRNLSYQAISSHLYESPGNFQSSIWVTRQFPDSNMINQAISSHRYDIQAISSYLYELPGKFQSSILTGSPGISGRCMELDWKLTGNCLDGIKMSGTCLVGDWNLLPVVFQSISRQFSDKNFSKGMVEGLWVHTN